jgi:hypothetical protein
MSRLLVLRFPPSLTLPLFTLMDRGLIGYSKDLQDWLSLPERVPTVGIFPTFCFDAKGGAKRSRPAQTAPRVGPL